MVFTTFMSKRLFMLRSLKRFRFLGLNTLMLFGIRASLPIKPISLKELKRMALRIILGLNYVSYVMLWGRVMFIFISKNRHDRAT